MLPEGVWVVAVVGENIHALSWTPVGGALTAKNVTGASVAPQDASARPFTNTNATRAQTTKRDISGVRKG